MFHKINNKSKTFYVVRAKQDFLMYGSNDHSSLDFYKGWYLSLKSIKEGFENARFFVSIGKANQTLKSSYDVARVDYEEYFEIILVQVIEPD